MTRTALFAKMDFSKPQTTAHDLMQKVGGQSAEWGAKSTLFCATEPSLAGSGGFFGPAYFQVAGNPISTNFYNTHRHEPSSPEARDPAACARLYDAAADLLEAATGAPLPHRLKAGAAPAALAEE